MAKLISNINVPSSSTAYQDGANAVSVLVAVSAIRDERVHAEKAFRKNNIYREKT